MKKTNISALLLALIAAIYVFVSLIGGLITNASVAFWIGFGFFTFNTLVACTVLLVFGNSKTTIKDVFLNAPIYYVGAAYFAVSGVVSVLNMLLPLLSLKWLVIVHILLFAVFTVYFVLSLVFKANAQNVTQQVADKNRFIRSAAAKVNTLAGCCEDRETRILLEKLAEDIQYSKPAAGDALEEIEDAVKQKIAILEYQLQTKDTDAAKESIKFIRDNLIARNQMI